MLPQRQKVTPLLQLHKMSFCINSNYVFIARGTTIYCGQRPHLLRRQSYRTRVRRYWETSPLGKEMDRPDFRELWDLSTTICVTALWPQKSSIWLNKCVGFWLREFISVAASVDPNHPSTSKVSKTWNCASLKFTNKVFIQIHIILLDCFHKSNFYSQRSQQFIVVRVHIIWKVTGGGRQ